VGEDKTSMKRCIYKRENEPSVEKLLCGKYLRVRQD